MSQWIPPIAFRPALILCLFIPQSFLAQEATAPPPAELTAEQKKLISAAEQAVRASSDAIVRAEATRFAAVAQARRIDKLVASKNADDATLRDFEELGVVANEVATANFLAADNDHEIITQLDAVKADVTKAQSALPTEGDQPKEIVAAKLSCDEAIRRIDDEKLLIAETQGQLKAAVRKIYSFSLNLADLLAKRLEPLVELPVDASADAVRNVLPRHLDGLQQVERLTRELDQNWQPLVAKLETIAINEHATEAPKVTDRITALRGQVKNVVGKALGTPGWLAALTGKGNSEADIVATKRNEVRRDPVQNSAAALVTMRMDSPLLDDLRAVHSTAVALETQLRNTDDLDFDSTTASNVTEQLDLSARRLKGALADLQDALAGDFTDFEADQISLFYFTDVPRLMQVLNPAMYEVGGVVGLRARAEEARRGLNEADIRLADAQAEVNTYQRRLEQLQEELRQARAQLLSSDDLLRFQTRKLEELQSRPNPDSGRIAKEKQRQDDLQRERDAANENADALQDEQNGLPAKIRDAQARLTEAQQQVRRRRTDILLLAQIESDAFAQARDNTPFYFAPAVGTSTDAAKRVLMYAFGDNKTVFLRGKSADLEIVRNIISLFDRPAPQSRLTLWALELNSTADTKGTRKFNESLELIESELSDSRARIATALSFLRDAINIEVNTVALRELAGQSITAPTARDLRWARLHFYQREVLMRLGFDVTSRAPSLAARPRDVSDWTIPDPAGTTTLGEALMVLTLGNPDSRQRIMTYFNGRFRERLNALGLRELPLSDRTGQPDGYASPPNHWFAASNRVMGTDLNPTVVYPFKPQHGTYALTAAQKEIVSAVQRATLQRILSRLRRLADELGQTSGVSQDNVVDEMLPLLKWLWDEFGVRPSGLLTTNDAAIRKLGTMHLGTQAKATIEAAKRQADPLRTANSRVAAADQMLKEIIIAFEDDIDRHFVQPMMNRLRKDLLGKGIGVGVISRTSVLATNRLVARVDARGSAQLALGEEQNILQAVQQLTQVVLSGQTGGPLGILGSLNALPRNNTSELYGLTTSGTFQVTPIFDPTGQALRFKLDQVFANLIREPDGTVNPQLPRIERHTVNTEVQLSNLELREVSRFNSNSRLGLPTRTSGGIPIFNSIPFIKDIPLIGWFVRKSGKAAVTQQSLIFGQTTMYPTIGDIMDLLRAPDYFESGLARDCPPCPDEEKKPTPPEK